MPKLDPGDPASPRIRVDRPHAAGRRSVPLDSSPTVSSGVRFSFPRSPIHGVTFGLFVFLVGQAMLVWAFLTGHFLAWSVANLVTVIGMVTALLSVTVTLRKFEKRIDALQATWMRTRSRRMRRKSGRISRKQT